MSCPECGGKLKSVTMGSSRITTCTECGWSVATSYIDPIYEDENEYLIYLKTNDSTKKAMLSAISKICSCNYLAAKKMLDAPGAMIFSGDALGASEAISLLREHDVSFYVQPEWPY